MTITVWLVWLASLTLMSVFGQTAALRWLILLMPFCLLASAAATWLASKRLSLSVAVREGGSKKQGAKGELTVENCGFLPVVQLRCDLLLDNLLTGERTEQTVSLPVLPNHKRKLAVSIKSRHCGHLAISFKQVVAVDFFGITRYKVRFTADADTIIMPNTFSIRVLPSLNSLCPEDSDEYEPDRAGHDVSEVHEIRGYVPGDSVRQIHWKLTSKYDQLMVKQAGQPLKHSMLLFIDFPSGNSHSASPDCLDALAEVAVSLSQALLDVGIAHIIAWQQADGGLGHYSVQNADDLTDVLPDMLSAQDINVFSSDGQGAALIENLNFSQMIWLSTTVPSFSLDTNAKMTVLCCVDKLPTQEQAQDETVILFTPRSYQQDVANLIL